MTPTAPLGTEMLDTGKQAQLGAFWPRHPHGLSHARLHLLSLVTRRDRPGRSQQKLPEACAVRQSLGLLLFSEAADGGADGGDVTHAAAGKVQPAQVRG